MFFILCPESRIKEVSEKVRGSDISIVTWENILEEFEKILDTVDLRNAIILKEFINYIKGNIIFIKKFEKKINHYRKSFPDYGSVLHDEFVHKIWYAFPYAGTRIGTGKSWIGYYFYDDKEGKLWDKGCRGWFGFVAKEKISMIKDKDKNYKLHESEFIVVSTYKPDKLSDEFIEIELTSEQFIPGTKNPPAWIVNFNEKWKDLMFWKEKLKPFYIEECKLP